MTDQLRRRAESRLRAVRIEFDADLERALAEPPMERHRAIDSALDQALGNIGAIRVDPYIDPDELRALTSEVEERAAAHRAEQRH